MILNREKTIYVFDSSALTKSMSDHSAARSRAALAESLTILAESEATAAATLSELRIQRETLQRAKTSADAVNENTTAAQNVLKWFKWPWG
jgi:uncharacterized protein YggE